ncbi:MAG: TetR/AcrR family transcriptional regulator [Paracoccaceae bacterium]
MTEISPRKTPRQRRSAATFEAILEAAARILEAGGPEALTTNHVAERAGVSIGSLYQYFPSKSAIQAELIRRLRRRMLDDLRAGVAVSRGLGLAETVDCLVRASMRHHADRPELARVLEFLEQTLPLDAETAEVKAQIGAEVMSVLAVHGVAEIETAAFDLSALTKGMVEAAVQAGEQDYEALAARISRAARGYLGV